MKFENKFIKWMISKYFILVEFWEMKFVHLLLSVSKIAIIYGTFISFTEICHLYWYLILAIWTIQYIIIM